MRDIEPIEKPEHNKFIVKTKDEPVINFEVWCSERMGNKYVFDTFSDSVVAKVVEMLGSDLKIEYCLSTVKITISSKDEIEKAYNYIIEFYEKVNWLGGKMQI